MSTLKWLIKPFSKEQSGNDRLKSFMAIWFGICLGVILVLIISSGSVLGQPTNASTEGVETKTEVNASQDKPEAKQDLIIQNRKPQKPASQDLIIEKTKPTYVPKDIKPTKEARKNTVIVEELQRFFGYENPLLSRYLSLPYDASMNSNVNGYHVEIGYLLLMFLPLLLIIGFARKPFWGLVTMGFSSLLVIISCSNSYIFSSSLQVVRSNIPNMDRYLARTKFEDAPVGNILAYCYKFLLSIYEPIKYGFTFISGAKDAITYPILIGLFVLFAYILHLRIKDHSRLIKSMVFFLYFYLFLWSLLSGGIVWYGYLALPMGILVILAAAERLKNRKGLLNKGLFASIMFFVFFWIGMVYVVRISHVHQVNRNAGKFMYDAAIMKYQTGAYTEQDVFDSYLKNINSAIDQINSDDQSLIYRAGTAFSYFIRKNDKRVLNDNLFGFFKNLELRYKEKETIAEVLKASGFKYIIVDLNAATYDKTPDKSVQKKFNRFMEFLNGNTKLELLATNRTIKNLVQSDPNAVTTYGVFGKINKPGTYAVYEIK